MVAFLAYVAMAIGAAAAFFLLLVGLVEAPWPLLLGGLLLALYSLQKVSVPVQDLIEATASGKPEPSVKNDGVKAKPTRAEDETLKYRGTSYNSQPPLGQPSKNPPTLVEGTYRGQHWQRSVTSVPNQAARSTEITYRGCKVRSVNPEQASSPQVQP